MLHVIDRHTCSLYAPQLEESFRIRHQVFVDGLGWEDLRQADGREIDQFDTNDTVHLVFLNDTGHVIGGSRLLPTQKPHLLSSVFPQLASAQPLPVGEDVFEWTRFYVAHGQRTNTRNCTVSRQIMCGILEYCLDNGITTLSAVAETYWIPRFFRLGWQPEPLGLPVEHQGDRIVGLKLRISEAALEKTRRGLKKKAAVLYRYDDKKPLILAS